MWGWNILPSAPVATKKTSADGGGAGDSSQEEALEEAAVGTVGERGGCPGPHPKSSKGWPLGGLHAAHPAGAGRVPGRGWGRDRGWCWWQIVWWAFIPTKGLQEGELGVVRSRGKVAGGGNLMRLGGEEERGEGSWGGGRSSGTDGAAADCDVEREEDECKGNEQEKAEKCG